MASMGATIDVGQRSTVDVYAYRLLGRHPVSLRLSDGRMELTWDITAEGARALAAQLIAAAYHAESEA